MKVRRWMAAALMMGSCAIWSCGDTPSPTAVGGVVEAPNGEIAAAGQRAWYAQLADAVFSKAWALTGLDPVGAGIEVSFQSIDGEGRVTATLIKERTASDGTYIIYTASNETPGSSLILSVGSSNDGTRMRAFMDSATTVDINPATEATFRLVLDSGFPLANFSADDLVNIQNEVDRATANIPAGDSIATANNRAEDAAAIDPGVQEAIEQAGG